MPQSLSSVLVHLVFRTKNREPWIRRAVEGQLHAYIGGILRDIQCPSLTVGGTADHVHILFVLSRTMAISSVVEEVKTGSSKWIKTVGPAFRNFHWQAGRNKTSIRLAGAAWKVFGAKLATRRGGAQPALLNPLKAAGRRHCLQQPIDDLPNRDSFGLCPITDENAVPQRRVRQRAQVVERHVSAAT